MLSRTILDVAETLEIECSEGLEFTPEMQARLIGIMREWHALASDLERGACDPTLGGHPGWSPTIVGGTDIGDQALVSANLPEPHPQQDLGGASHD